MKLLPSWSKFYVNPFGFRMLAIQEIRRFVGGVLGFGKRRWRPQSLLQREQTAIDHYSIFGSQHVADLFPFRSPVFAGLVIVNRIPTIT
jgi:hypothetical protein